MINHFNAHKQEFNALVQSYGEYGRDPLEWSQRPEVIELKTKTGVWSVGDSINYWFDDPYSLEAAKKIKQMRDDESFDQNHSRKSVIVRMENRRVHKANYLLTGFNWKDYFYFPMDPRIEHGRIKLPRQLDDYKFPDRFHLWLPVVNSTDFVPWWIWKRGGCVMRKIEPRWYIKRCRMN